MDWTYMGKLMLSVAIFAPGLIILSVLLFVGILMAFEKMGIFAVLTKSGKIHGGAPVVKGDAGTPPGPIVAALKESLDAEGAEQEEDEREARPTGTSDGR